MTIHCKCLSDKEPNLVRIKTPSKPLAEIGMAHSVIHASTLLSTINDCRSSKYVNPKHIEYIKRYFLGGQFVNLSVILNKRRFNRSADLIKRDGEVFLDLTRGGLNVIDNHSLIKGLQIACNERPLLGNAVSLECTIGLGWERDKELSVKNQISRTHDVVSRGVCDGRF